MYMLCVFLVKCTVILSVDSLESMAHSVVFYLENSRKDTPSPSPHTHMPKKTKQYPTREKKALEYYDRKSYPCVSPDSEGRPGL